MTRNEDTITAIVAEHRGDLEKLAESDLRCAKYAQILLDRAGTEAVSSD